ncbi:reticulon-1a isoform X2 [Archocentrus centrarchus]|uniref:reticulon-1a isoform X2 n=1 Tax=Archocentrus centrarchus TaxID=63155 RepID=UPI0011EA31F1|nr:reticulon-1 isoform X2 [Archocentrus centrarchus]
MSAQPGEEWFGDDYERNGLFGNTSTRFGELREEFKPRGDALGDLDQQFHPFQDDAKRPPVAMETASTDDPMSGLFRKPMNDDGDVYTSLLSNQSFTTGQEASYLSDDLKPSSHSSGSSTLDHFSSDTYSFSSKMTSSQASDTPKSLLGSDKTESYNYMDISHGDERHDQQQGVLHGLLDKSSAGHDLLGSYIDKNPGGDEDDEENLGPALGSHSFPYVEEPSDEELGDYRSYRNLGDTPQSASPVKITLTESQPTATKTEPPPHSVNASERESVLSVGLQGVPTVTLSEPEDDSPASTPNASPTTIDLLYWRNVKQSGAVFSSVLLLLFSLTQFSVVSVGAYLALAALSATISFRIYKSVLQAVQKTDEGHPFKGYLEMEIALSQDQISKYADKILLYTNTCMKELRRLFLVQDLVDSLKFAVLMWLLTYVGALFNGLTLLILAVVSMFTLPVVYEKHQAQIDQYVGLIRTHVNSVVGKIQAKIPGAKRKEE